MSAPDGEGPELPRLEYPLDYAFKVFGLAADDFPAHARWIVESACGLEAQSVTTRPSSAGKYLAASVTVRLESEDQRRAVYAALKADPRVLYTL